MTIADDILEARLSAVKAELKVVYDNLARVQGRCTELIQETRAQQALIKRMEARWILLLENSPWEKGPRDDTYVGSYELHLVREKVRPSCTEAGHNFGHGEFCFYCGARDEEEVTK
jgi:hypothetical protein